MLWQDSPSLSRDTTPDAITGNGTRSRSTQKAPVCDKLFAKRNQALASFARTSRAIAADSLRCAITVPTHPVFHKTSRTYIPPPPQLPSACYPRTKAHRPRHARSTPPRLPSFRTKSRKNASPNTKTTLMRLPTRHHGPPVSNFKKRAPRLIEHPLPSPAQSRTPNPQPPTPPFVHNGEYEVVCAPPGARI